MLNSGKLTDVVNKSGFPLQIGLGNLVQETTRQHGWNVCYQEHAWANHAEGSSGFIDLVLSDKNECSLLVVECKRVLDSSWVFLITDQKAMTRRHAKGWVYRYTGSSFRYFDWKDLTLEPTTPESAYCVIPGQDAKSKPMLERIASDVVAATEGIATEEKRLVARSGDSLRMYFSVIATTARLMVCEFDPTRVNINNGAIEQGTFSEVPYVRFRKQLSTREVKWPIPLAGGARTLVNAKENTVFVVNSEHLLEFIGKFYVDDSAIRELK
jgi:hypothetical protein